MARPSAKPPKNSHITGCANCADTGSSPATPSAGSTSSGSSAVTGSGSASVSHQVPIHSVSAATCQAAGEKPPGAGMASSSANSAGPASSAARDRGLASGIEGGVPGHPALAAQGAPV